MPDTVVKLSRPPKATRATDQRHDNGDVTLNVQRYSIRSKKRGHLPRHAGYVTLMMVERKSLGIALVVNCA